MPASAKAPLSYRRHGFLTPLRFATRGRTIRRSISSAPPAYPRRLSVPTTSRREPPRTISVPEDKAARRKIASGYDFPTPTESSPKIGIELGLFAAGGRPTEPALQGG